MRSKKTCWQEPGWLWCPGEPLLSQCFMWFCLQKCMYYTEELETCTILIGTQTRCTSLIYFFSLPTVTISTSDLGVSIAIPVHVASFCTAYCDSSSLELILIASCMGVLVVGNATVTALFDSSLSGGWLLQLIGVISWFLSLSFWNEGSIRLGCSLPPNIAWVVQIMWISAWLGSDMCLQLSAWVEADYVEFFKVSKPCMSC